MYFFWCTSASVLLTNNNSVAAGCGGGVVLSACMRTYVDMHIYSESAVAALIRTSPPEQRALFVKLSLA